MKNFKFIFSTNDLQEVNIGVVGIVQFLCNETKEIKNVSAFLLSFKNTYIITFLNKKNVVNVYLDSSSLIKNSFLLVNEAIDYYFGTISFDLNNDSKNKGEDFSIVTGLLYPNLKSNLYEDSDCKGTHDLRNFRDFTVFALEDLILGEDKVLALEDFNVYANLTNTIKNKKSFLNFASCMITTCANISLLLTMEQKNEGTQSRIADCIAIAQNARARFAKVLFNEDINNSSVERIVFEEPQRFLMPSIDNNPIVEDSEEDLYDDYASAEDFSMGYPKSLNNYKENKPMKIEFERRGRVAWDQAKSDRKDKFRKSGQFLKSVPEIEFDVKAKYGHLNLEPNNPNSGLYPVEVAVAITKDLCPGLNLEEFIIDYELYGLDEVYYLPRYLIVVAHPFSSQHYVYEAWVDSLVAKHEEELLKQEDESYVYNDAEFGYFEDEAKEILANTDGLDKPKETVYSPINNTNNTKEPIMSNFKFDRNAEPCDDSFNEDIDPMVEANSQAKKEDSVEDTIQKSSPVQINTNTNKNTEVKPMTSFQERKAAMQAQYDATVEETNSDKRPASFRDLGKMRASAEELLEAVMAADNTEAAANGQEKSKETASTNTKTNSIPKTKTMDNTAPKTLIALNIVLNIVKVGGAAGRTSAMIKQRKEKWNVLRNKKASTICDLKGVGSICFNRETDIPFLQFASLYLENGVSEAYGNSNAVLIEEYSDGTKKMLNTEETEAAWRTILNADDDVVIGNLNLKLKADLPMSSSDLMDKLDDGTIQAINFRFDKPNDKMFTFKQVARYNGTEFDTYLYMPGTSVISFLRDSADFDKDFLNYKGKKSSPKNKFGNSSKVVGNRNLPSQAVVARPQAAAAVAGAQNMFEVGVPKTAPAPAPVAVAVVIDTEKDTLRAENVALKAEVSELKTQIADLTAGQTRMEAMLAQLVAAQAVKTVEVSIPEIVEVVAPAAPVEVSAFDIALEASIQARLASDELAIHDCDPLDEGYAAEMAARSAADNARRTLFSLAIPQVELDARIAEAKANLEVCNAADKAAGKPQFGVDNAETAYANTKFNQLKNLQSAEKKAENAVSGTLFS